MKRLLSIVISLILVLSLFVSCTKDNNEKPSEGYDNNLLMVYFCGSDLESKNGRASANIDELLNASIPKNTKVVIQTGGAAHWNKEEINPNRIERYEIKDGNLSLIEALPLTSMGNKDTLQSFLEYCESNYKETNKSLIMWNHGGGAMKGCCFDEIYSFDSLLITEITSAILGSKMAPLDFIGFDACLMGSIEVAYALKDCAKYMVASEETEPGRGWDYKAIAESYGKDSLETTMDVIVDSYYTKCETTSSEMNVTLSAVDLSKIDDVVRSFDSLFAEIGNNIDNIGIWKISQTAGRAHSFGGRSIYERKSNIVDLYEFAESMPIYGELANALKTTISNCVVKKKNGALKEGCGGLSFYYPYALNSDEIQLAKDLVVSNGYKSFILDNFVNASNNLISFVNQGSKNEHGAFEIAISESSIKYVRSVKYSLFEFINSQENMLVPSMGTAVDIYNETPGVYSSNFKGSWINLNGVELQCTYLGEENGYVVYSSRVKVNGDDKFLRFAYSYDTREFVLLGTWEGINGQGMSDKTFDELKTGDIVVPLYYIYDENYERTTVDGASITIVDNNELSYAPLKQTYYQYVFVVEDIFGRLYYSYSAVLKMKYTYDELLNSPLTGKYDFAAEIDAISDSVTLVL